MTQPRGWTHLSAELSWMLAGIPLCIFAGVGWDAFQDANGTQSFLGASNNFYFLWLLPMMLLGAPRAFRAAIARGGNARTFTLLALALLIWMAVGLWSNGQLPTIFDAILPSVAILNIVAALLAWMLARRTLQDGYGEDLHTALTHTLLAAGAGCALGAAVHLLGAWPEQQVFLFVDGFANLRTFGETVMVAFAAALVLWWKRPGWGAFALAIALATLLAWSGTRAAWVGLAGMLTLGLIVWQPGWKAFAGTIAIVVAGGVASLALPTPHGTYGIGRLGYLANEASFVLEHTTQNAAPAEDIEAGSSRLALWSWGVDRISERPWTGYGYAAMGSVERPNEARFKHLHNLPLDLAFGLGVPAAIALTLALLYALVAATFQARRDGLWLGPLCAGALLATSLFAGIFLFPITVIIVAIGLSGVGVVRRA